VALSLVFSRIDGAAELADVGGELGAPARHLVAPISVK